MRSKRFIHRSTSQFLFRPAHSVMAWHDLASPLSALHGAMFAISKIMSVGRSGSAGRSISRGFLWARIRAISWPILEFNCQNRPRHCRPISAKIEYEVVRSYSRKMSDRIDSSASIEEIPQLPLRVIGIGGKPKSPLVITPPSSPERADPKRHVLKPARAQTPIDRDRKLEWRTSSEPTLRRTHSWRQKDDKPPQVGRSSTSSPSHQVVLSPSASPTRANRTPTYISHGPLPTNIGEITAKYMPGWERADKNPTHADFILCISGGGNGWFDHVRSRLKCRLDASILTDKFQLHTALTSIAPWAIQPTSEVVDSSTCPDGSAWMIRANWGWGGMSCGAVDNSRDLHRRYLEWCKKPSSTGRRSPRAHVMASEYIVSPKLFNGYKFHARLHICAVLLSARRDTSTPDTGATGAKWYYRTIPTIDLVCARMPYTFSDLANNKIHVTTEVVGELSAHPDEEILRKNAIELLDTVMCALMPGVKLYTESQNAYEIYAVDIMFHDDNRAVLIDINSTPRMTGRANDIGRELVEVIYTTAFADVFGRAK